MFAEGGQPAVEARSDCRVPLTVEQCLQGLWIFVSWRSTTLLPKPLFVFTELHAENSKNEDDVDTGLLGMNCSFYSSDDLFFVFLNYM